MDKKIKKLRRIAGGDTYTIIYLKMLLSSMHTDGKIFIEGVEETTAEEIALEIDEDADNVAVVLQFLIKTGLAQLVDNDVYMTRMPELIGSECSSAERVRRHRETQKALQCNADVTEPLRIGNVEREKEREKDIEIDREGEEDQKTLAPTLSDIKDECAARNSSIDPEIFFNYYEACNWEGIKNWKAKLTVWEKRESNNHKTEKKQNRFSRCAHREYTPDQYQEMEEQLLNRGSKIGET